MLRKSLVSLFVLAMAAAVLAVFAERLGIPPVGRWRHPAPCVHLGPPWLAGTPRNYAWFTVASLALLAVLIVPGLSIRTWAPGMIPPGAAFVPLAGLLILSLSGIGIWMAGPTWLVRLAYFVLPALALLTMAIAVTWWKGGSPLASAEEQDLAIWLTLALGSLAFGVAPLPVDQEYEALSTAQSRMIASPPDHGIPYVTAAYFLYGKNGRQDNDRYFGDPWSVTSRGPLVPFALAATDILFGERPSDPPHFTLTAWPAAEDGFYLARILGILTNALVILGGVALTRTLYRQIPGSAGNDLPGRISLVWLATAPGMIINTDFIWPKLLSAFLITLAAEAILERRPTYWPAVWTSAAYYAHPVGAIFAPGLCGLMLLAGGAPSPGSVGINWERFRKPTGYLFYSALLVAPWLYFKHWLGRADVMLTYPLGDGNGLRTAATAGSWLAARWHNLWYTLVPGAFLFSPHMHRWIVGDLSPAARWGINYAKTLPGELGQLSFGVAAVLLFRRSSTVMSRFRSTMLLGPFLIMLIYWGFSSDGLGRNCLEPLAVLLISYTAAVWPDARRSWRWLLVFTAAEGCAVRVIGILADNTLTSASLNLECVLLLALSLVCVALPCMLLITRPPSRLDSPKI